MLKILERDEHVGEFAYEWRPKSDPVLWIADALCSPSREHLLETEYAHHWTCLQASNVVGEPIYVASTNA